MRAFAMLKYLAGKGQVTLVGLSDRLPYKEESLPTLKPYCEKVVVVHRAGPQDQESDLGQAWKTRVADFLKTNPWDLLYGFCPEFDEAVRATQPETFDLIVANRFPMMEYLLRHPKAEVLLKRTAIDVDDVVLRQYEQKMRALASLRKRAKHWVGVLMMKRFYRRMNRAFACFTVSEVDQTYLLRNRLAKQVFVVPNTVPVNGEAAFPPRENDRPNLLFIGTLGYRPNEEAVSFFCERVFPLIQKRRPDAQFTVVGPHASEKILRFAQQPGVRFAGFAPSTKPFYDQATLAVVPLLNGTGTRIKILEAMAFQKPVVSTSIGCEGLEVTHGENILVADDPEKFAEYCVALIQNPEQRTVLAAKGHQLVKDRYDTPVFHRALDAFLDAYLKEAR